MKKGTCINYQTLLACLSNPPVQETKEVSAEAAEKFNATCFYKSNQCGEENEINLIIHGEAA